MKILFSMIILLISLTIHAAPPTCTNDQILACAKSAGKDQQAFMACLSPECKASLTKQMESTQPCDNDAKTTCQGKKDQDLIACLQKSGSKECKTSLKKNLNSDKVQCPPSPCLPFSKENDADKIHECNLNFYKQHPECLSKSTNK